LRLKRSMDIKSQLARNSANARWNKSIDYANASERNANASERNANGMRIDAIKVKESKEKESKEKETKQNEIVLCAPEIEKSNFYIFKEHENIKRMANEIHQFFSIDEINFTQKFHKVFNYLYCFHTLEKYDHFVNQFMFYRKYKIETGEKIHGWDNFWGDFAENNIGGAWNSENWKAKFETIKSKTANANEKLDHAFAEAENYFKNKKQ